jgi:hypothetical protein
MSEIPEGMLPQTFEYILAFTTSHEGDTPFMYNNWPLKNPTRDVTVGIGLAINSEDQAASDEIRNMFRIKLNPDETASEDDMRTEFRRVFDLPRTATNLFSDYRDKSPLVMDRDAMLRKLQEKMLAFWQQKGQEFANLDRIPAQAQVALISYNYGLRLRGAPKMCKAVRDGDYLTAAAESNVPGWDAKKNEAHKVLFTNAATIVNEELDLSMLPPVEGPFKPPPSL